MKINHGAMLQNVGAIRKNTGLVSNIHNKMATGKKINSASDDASGLAMAKELAKQVRGFRTANKGIGDALGAMRIADGTGGQVTDLVQRQRELALQASNGTLSQSNRDALNQEYQALNDEITRISEASQFNGQGVANGSSPLSDGTGQIQTGPNSGQNATLNAVDFRSSSIGAGGDISSIDGAQAALASSETALENVNSIRANIGAQMNQFEHKINNNNNQEINTASAQSMIEDLDYAQASMESSRANLLHMSSIEAQGHFNQVAKNNMMHLLS